VSEELHVIRLERDLGRLEGVVGELVRGITLDRENLERQRKDLYAFVKESNARNERTIEALSKQIELITRGSVENQLQHARSGGQWQLSRWILATGMTALALASGYMSGRRAAEEVITAPDIPRPTEQHRPGRAFN
jgi:hypothetical protein